ncbi:MAG TPA: hypothetical protein VF575_02935 [Candidatus Saccharimonadales bacterium]|jgi:hypothetical protein
MNIHLQQLQQRLRTKIIWAVSYLPGVRRYPVLARLGWGMMALLMSATVYMQVFEARVSAQDYKLSPKAEKLVGRANSAYAASLRYDAASQSYEYNKGYKPGDGASGVTGLGGGPKFSANFSAKPELGSTIIDPVSQASLTMKPKFAMATPVQDDNRLVYPLLGKPGQNIYTFKGDGYKEDIVLNAYAGDALKFAYDLVLSDGTEARLEQDGSLGVYGVSNSLLGNVTTGTAQDQELLSKARTNGEKNNLLFTIPAPFIRESGSKSSGAKAWFSLEKNVLTMHADRLKQATYPLSIDPSVYVETATKLMRGNNETNVDFDTSNELIQKGKLTGARFDAWTTGLTLPAARWNFGSAVAGGYAYVVGGSSGSVNQSNVYWAKFDTSTNAIVAPNPGNGACASWCTDTAYNLPAARAGLSVVAYNGYLYAFGGVDGAGARSNSVYIAKLGQSGEPALWHPTDTNQNNWVYWHTAASLTSERSYSAAVAYNNRMYLLGGQTNANSGGVNTVEVADINPIGTLSSWSIAGMTVMPSVRHNHSVQIYNDRMYAIGGNSNGTLQNSVQYIKISSDGTLASSWVTTTPFTTARMAWGGNMSTIWGGYIYVGGGCTSLTTGNCSAAGITGGNTIQLASINADGSLTDWSDIIGVTAPRIGYGLLAWRNTLYGIGGCTAQNTTTGACSTTAPAIQYGVINGDGDASTVNSSQPYSAGVVAGNPCSGFATGSASLNTCNIPPAGSGAGQGGQMNSGVVVNNGYIYVIGGCTDISQTNECTANGGASAMSGNVSYAAIASDGTIVAPASCSGTFSSGTWCVDSTNKVPNQFYSTGTACQGNAANNCTIAGTNITGNGTTWTAAMVGMNIVFANGSRGTITARNNNTSLTVTTTQAVANQNYVIYTSGLGTMAFSVFNNTLYVYGGTDGTGTFETTLSYVALNADGSLSGAWTPQTAAATGLSTTGRGYSYMFTRANPASAGTNPGNMYIMGGCSSNAGVGCSAYYTENYKCNITIAGSVSGCSTAGQLQVDADPGVAGNQGLGLMAGAVYANYVYLVGGSDANTPQRGEIIYAKIDNSNNIVAVTGTIWTVSSEQLNPVRRRGFAFGYNGYLYALAGYNGTASLNDLLYAKINVSNGSIEPFNTSNVTVTTRWDLRAIVANGYVYAIGGCSTGAPPASCTAMTASIQTFQLYNNYSGSPTAYNTTSTTGVDRIGGSATVLNGYVYYSGGCTVIACTTASNSTYYAPLNPDGTVGAWTLAASTMPAVRAWGKLVAAGGTLYYVGGQDSGGAEQATVYYTSGISNGVPTWSITAATNGLPAVRSQIGASVWNNRIYVTGGLDGANAAQTTVYRSPDMSAGGNISSAWVTTDTAFNIARSGHTTMAYAGNLYVLGGFDGTNYLNDVQYAKISSTGAVGAWSYTTSLPQRVYQADGFTANGYMYLFGGRSNATTCTTNTYIAPISANTTIASGNNPTGLGDWSQTNVKYAGARYGVAAAYDQGRAYILGGGCTAMVAAGERAYYSTLQSQPQVAKYSLLIDTDTDVFPSKWLMNGLDNDVGARWKFTYRSSTDATAAWGQTTDYGTVTLGTPATYTPVDSVGTNTNFARYYYLSVSIDSSQAFGYPEDVSRGPTINDLSLFFTSDPSKRLIHGKTFTGGVQQPLDTPIP